MKCFALTDPGLVRKDNQDNYVLQVSDEKHCIIASICDGMGGANAGRFASSVANKEYTDYIFSRLSSRIVRKPDMKRILTDACNEANGVSYEFSTFDESFEGMGTTLVGGVIADNGRVYIVNVGDSRAYRISARTESITQVTRDHSLVADLVESGAITKEEARTHPQKNVITRALGTERSVRSDYYEFSLRKGDMLLLCTDGLTNYVTEKELYDYYEIDNDPENFCKAMRDLVYDRGAGDNITLIAVVNRT